MKTLVITSQKGGVGKTTLALNLSFSLARNGYRTVLIDADPQGAVGYSLGASHSPGLSACITEGCAAQDAMLATRLQEFRILPAGTLPPQRVPQFDAAMVDGGRLSRLFGDLQEDTEIAVVDTASGFGGATLGAMRACDWALTPLQAEPVALRTLPQLLAAIGNLRHEGSRVQLLGIVLCMLQQRNADSLGVAEEVWAKLPTDLVLETIIPRDPAVLAASSAAVPLGLLSRSRPSPLSLVFEQLAAEVAPKLGLQEGEMDGPLSLFA